MRSVALGGGSVHIQMIPTHRLAERNLESKLVIKSWKLFTKHFAGLGP